MLKCLSEFPILTRADAQWEIYGFTLALLHTLER